MSTKDRRRRRAQTSPSGGARVLDMADAAQFAAAAEAVVAERARSMAAARKTLREFGFIDRHGKLTKNYR